MTKDERAKKAREKIDMKYIEDGAGKIDGDDMEKVVRKADEIKYKFESKGPLHRFLKDFRLLIQLVRDYWSNRYRAIPWWAISGIVFALLYVLNPADLLPDFIPGLGYMDDAMVVSLCLMMIERELEKYNDWKRETRRSSSENG
ncbi:DUF1232 domain-containing protein [Candidatus Fermentibacteria bacterium]|nr:DUF1232 domain-containing protein [Candidatus Fermentibacteria bacterium]